MFRPDRQDQKVFGWWADFDGCRHYRIAQPMDELNGYTTYVGMQGFNWITRHDRILPPDWRDYDVVVGQRVCNADAEDGPAQQWIRVCNDQDVLSVYEIDDDLLNVSPSNPTYEFFSDGPTRGNIKACASSADMVTVSTEPLREVMLKYNPNVHVLPNYIDISVLDIERPYSKDKLIIGWSGSGTHKTDFPVIGNSLRDVMDENPHTLFMTIGGAYGEGLPQDRVRRRGWIHATRRLYPHIANFDIGIAPLLNDAFNASKSYIKVLEYAALGIPCIASGPHGPYEDFIEHGVTGFIAETKDDWALYLHELVSRHDLRIDMGIAARKKAREFTTQKNLNHIAEVYVA